MSTRINPSLWTWFNEPKLYIFSSDKLILESEPQSKMDTFHQDKISAFGLLGEELTDFCYEARIDYALQNVLDECGLIIKISDDDWWKYGVRSKNKDINEIFCEHYLNGYFDGSYRDIGKGIKNLYFRMITKEKKMHFMCSADGKTYRNMRRVEFGDKIIATPGIYACSPGNSFFDCTFSKIEIGGMNL